MADQVQWGPLVQKLLKKKGNEGLELPKLVKKAVKAAHAQHQDLGKKALQRALESFLGRCALPTAGSCALALFELSPARFSLVCYAGAGAMGS